MSTHEKLRTVEVEMTIDAPAERVWNALTDPEELMRWFPLEARVTPGAGGKIFLGWGEGLESDCGIEVWEPGRHLRTGWLEPVAKSPEEAHRLAVDYTLETRGGSTTLRLVHSGFGQGERWDEEYDGISRGWQFELRSLRHYLERHHGKRRVVAWVRHALQATAQEAWDRMWSARGLLREGELPGSEEGRPYRFTTAAGDRLEGRVLVFRSPTDFAATVDNLQGSLFRFGFETFSGRPEVMLWLSSWDFPESRLAEVEGRWRSHLAELFGPAE